jgi:hypothetical protein
LLGELFNQAIAPEAHEAFCIALGEAMLPPQLVDVLLLDL